MADRSHSDELHQPMSQSKEVSQEDRPQPVQFARRSERSELSEQSARRRRSSKRKPGRPRLSQVQRVSAPPKQKEDEESLCFICFDGGDLVVCEHRGCPKVYHPACVNRNDEFFKTKGQWTCGWHICNNCKKSAQFKCYTCTYSLCKRCMKDAEFACVKGSKGFCDSCMKTVMLVETKKCADETTDMVDHDDESSWLNLFKDYWVDLKAKFSLTLEDLKNARNPSREMPAVSYNLESLDKSDNASDERITLTVDSSGCCTESISLRSKERKRSRYAADDDIGVKQGERTACPQNSDWASKELLEFVAHVKNGDISVLSQYDVLKLLFGYIEQNNLWDLPKYRVSCDSQLQSLFGRPQVGHLEMLSLLEPHFIVKEASPLAIEDNQGGVVYPDPTKMDVDGKSDASIKPSGDHPQMGPVSALTLSSTTSTTEKIWHYQDPSGKNQGPFSMAQLAKWSSNGFFPNDLRIWRTFEKQDDSILLTDAVDGRFLNKLPQHEHNSTKCLTGVAPILDLKLNDSGCGEEISKNPTAAIISCTRNTGKFDSLTAQQSANLVDGKPATSSAGRESSNTSNASRPVAPFLRNSFQPPNYQYGDGRRGYNSRWHGNRSSQNNWNSNRPRRRFQHNGGGSEWQHPCQSSSSHLNQVGGGSNGLSINPPQPLNMGWGIAPQVPNSGPVQGVGNMMKAANMAWGAPPNMNVGWGSPAQVPTNPNAGRVMSRPVMQGAGQGSMNNMRMAWDPSGIGNPHTWAGQQQEAGDGQSSQGGGGFHPNFGGV